jgi:hypothetical protein
MRRLLIFTIVLFNSVFSYSQSDTIRLLSEARELQKHAELYFWYATDTHHQLKNYKNAKEFCIKSNNIIIANDLTHPEAKELLDINNIMLSNIEEIEVINIDNINGRYPLFNEIMNINTHKVLIDDPIELSIEASIEAAGKQLKGSQSIFNITYFTVIETNYSDPVLVEVIRQSACESSSHYVINSHELVKILGENKINFDSEDLLTISNYYNTNILGVLNVNLVDSVDNIYYNSCSFSEYSISSNTKTQIAYAETFKKDVKARATHRAIFFLLVLTFLLGLFAFFRGWREVSWIHYFITATLLSYIFTFLLILALRFYDLNGTEYYLEIQSISWRILTSILFSVVPLILTYIGIMKLKFLVEEVNKPSSIVAIIYGVCISSITIFISLDIFEHGLTNNLYNYLLIAVILFIPSQTSGRIASKLLINQHFINLLPLLINLFAITYVLYAAIEIHTITQTIALILPVTVFSVIPLKYESIIRFFNTTFKITEDEAIEISFDHPIYIKPDQFDDKIQNIFSRELLQINIITGGAGTGKTRFVREIEKTYPIYYGNCDEETSVIEYEPFVEAFISLGAGTFSEQSATAKKLEKGFVALSEIAGAGGEIISALAGEGKDEIRDKKFIIKEITNHLKAKETKSIIVIEDINNIDEHSLELLKNLIYEIGVNYDDFNTVSFLLTTSDKALDNESNDLFFLKELQVNEIIINNLLYDDLNNQYHNLKEEFLKNMDLVYESEMIIMEFIEDVNENPLHLVEVVKLIDTYKMFNHDGKLSLTKNADLRSLPKTLAVSKIYNEEIKALDTELFNILECAAYIGKSFEADVIVHIINKNRLDILNRLREAEELGLIIDKSDQDDIYEFSSRALMKEIRSFGIQKESGNPEINVSQIVKEYNERVINFYFPTDDDSSLDNLNINILISLANRSYENNYFRKSYNPRCIKLNKVAGERTLSMGKHQTALKIYVNLFKLAKKFDDLELRLESLLIIVQCHIKTEDVNTAIDEYEAELLSLPYSGNNVIERDLLVAKLYFESSREADAYERLQSIGKNDKILKSQEIRLKMLLAESHDYREEDDEALKMYLEILQDEELDTNTETNIRYHLCDLHIQHGRIDEALKESKLGYKVASDLQMLDCQINFLLVLFTISLKTGNKKDFELHKENIRLLSEQSSVNITSKWSALWCKFIQYIDHDQSIELSDINSDIDRLLKMVRYKKNSHAEIKIFILKIIVDVLEGNVTNCISTIENKYLAHNKLDGDVRMKMILTLIYTDLTILNGDADFNYFNQIEINKVKEIPTLLPKFNYLIALRDGANIIHASQSYLDDIKDSKTYFMAEELSFSIKLSNDKALINDVSNKIFLSNRIQHFLND